MRLWSVHPRYLDAKGLVAVWREGLLARHVLLGQTRGYRHHPQLERFRRAPDPLAAIDVYLAGILDEAERRGYAFARGKIEAGARAEPIAVTEGQIGYEWKHLLAKLARRDPDRWRAQQSIERVEAHPLFRITPGPVEAWERAGE